MGRYTTYGVRLLAAYFLLQVALILISPIVGIATGAYGEGVAESGLLFELIGQSFGYAVPSVLVGGALLILAAPIGAAVSGDDDAEPSKAAMGALGRRLGGIFLIGLALDSAGQAISTLVWRLTVGELPGQAIVTAFPQVTASALLLALGVVVLLFMGRRA